MGVAFCKMEEQQGEIMNEQNWLEIDFDFRLSNTN